MYYESISHTRLPVSDAAAAATLIHSGDAAPYQAICWQSPVGELAAVADGGINGVNNPWGEVAVINLRTMTQIESITFAWIESLEEKIKSLHDCESCDFQMGPTTLPLDGSGNDVPAYFTCGCCGSSFKSTIAEQAKHDQDSGFGICPNCASKYYA